MPDPRAILAANNNADLYEAVFAAHGKRFERRPMAFVSLDPPPPFYANVSLTEPADPDRIRALAREAAGRSAGSIGLKDSFCMIDPGEDGFSALFSASWIWRAPQPSTPPAGWRAIRTPDDLFRWETAWAGRVPEKRQFPDIMLDDPAITFFAEWDGDAIRSGVIANRSHACIGLSNIFSKDASSERFAAAAGCAQTLAPLMPIVGYELGDDLEAAIAAGFEAVGELQVLISTD